MGFSVLGSYSILSVCVMVSVFLFCPPRHLASFAHMPRYFDYADENEAREAEDKIAESLGADMWVDTEFDAVGSSLYLNEFKPPRGSHL